MTQALKFHAVITGKTLTIDALEAFDGQRVEVIVLAEEQALSPAGRGVTAKRNFGTMAGKIKIGEDFDEPLPSELQDAFDGGQSR